MALGGNGSLPSSGCAGGNGGKGGNGGNGGGGLGGHSLGVAFSGGTAPVLDNATKNATTFGTNGTGGLGGAMNADSNPGADGVAASCWDLTNDAACM